MQDREEEEVQIWAALNPTGDAALVLLLEKIERSEDLLARFEAYFVDPERDLSRQLRAYLLDWMERKRDQIDYERHRVYQIGLAIAAGRDTDPLDI